MRGRVSDPFRPLRAARIPNASGLLPGDGCKRAPTWMSPGRLRCPLHANPNSGRSEIGVWRLTEDLRTDLQIQSLSD